jgi:hypothetical protein
MDSQGWDWARAAAGRQCRIDLSVLDADAMDVALSLMPDLQLAAVAVARANRVQGCYPIATSRQLAELLHIVDLFGSATYLLTSRHSDPNLRQETCRSRTLSTQPDW